jgi:hypothetical protein
MRVSSVVVRWIRTHGAMGSNSGQVKCVSYCCHVILHNTKNHYNKVPYFSKIYNHSALYVTDVSGANGDSTSQVRSSAMLVLPIFRNPKIMILGYAPVA